MSKASDLMPDERVLEELAQMLSNAQRIAFFTGAGISTESGIADFRSPGGIWAKLKPIQFNDFVNDEDYRLEDWRRRFHFQKEFDSAPLNDGHITIASIMQSRRGLGVITQNIDGLHHRSGIPAEHIIELHGNGVTAACLDCRMEMTLQAAQEYIEQHEQAPTCQACGGLVKSNVISFGQSMPVREMLDAEKLMRKCDLLLILGSSLVVQPAASLPIIAKNNGAKLVIINRDPTPLDALADLNIRASLGKTLKISLEKTDIPLTV